MKIDAVFVYINLVNGHISGAEYQLDCAYARSFLNKAGINTVQYINKNSSRYENIVNDLIGYCADNYIIYFNEYNYFVSHILVEKLKRKNKQSKVIAFGPIAEYMSRSLWTDMAVDCYIIGEPYYALKRVIKRDDLGKIPNIAYRQEEVIIRNEVTKEKIELDNLGTIYSSGIVPYEEAGNIGMITSQGCYGNCIFCSYPKGEINASHSVDYILNELDYIHFMTNGSLLYLSFFDDCFSLNTQRTIELCEAIAKKNYNMQFWCCTRADLLNEELLQKMKDSNFKNIVIGMETASLDLLSKSGKVPVGETASSYFDKIEYCYNYGKNIGINPMLSILFGMPGEKEEDIKATVDWITKNKADSNLSVCYMTCFPGSKIFESSEELNVKKECETTGFPYKTYFHNYDMKKIYRYLRSKRILKDNDLEYYEQFNRQRVKMIASYSGVFSGQELSLGMDTIVVGDYVTSDMIDYIGSNLELNGTLVVEADKLKINNKDLYTDDRKRLKYSLENYDELIAKFYKTKNFVSNIAFISKGNVLRILVNSMFRDKELKLQKREIAFIQQVKELELKVRRMVEEHIIPFSDVRNGLLKNSCRFSNSCTVSNATRIRLSEKGISLCFEKDEMEILNDEYHQTLHKIQNKYVESFEKRGCNTCSARKRCAKCISLPEGLTQEMYCNLIQENEFLEAYIKVVVLLNKRIENMQEYNDNEEVNVYLPKSSHAILEGTAVIEFRREIGLLHLKSNQFIPVTILEREYVLSGLENDMSEFSTFNSTKKKYFEKLNARGIITLLKN